MPTIDLNYRDLCSLVGRRISPERLKRSLMMLGMEAEILGEKMRLEIFHNRPDLLSPEGVARALSGFLGVSTGLPLYRTDPPKVRVAVDRSVGRIRQFIAAGVVRGVKLNDDTVSSLMQVQEKLHSSLCRSRRKGSIGVYDLDTIKPPVRYTTVGAEEIKFVPLESGESLTPKEVLKRHQKGVEYGKLLSGFSEYPILLDSKDTVLSMPPIVNSEDTRVKESTRNLFIDVTGTDEKIVNRAIVIVMTGLAERGFKLESVTVEYPNRTVVTPDLSNEKIKLNVGDVNRILNLGLDAKAISKIATRMRYGAKPRGKDVEITVPAYRADILHPVDMIEDLAIGYGYGKIQPTIPKVPTVGGRLRLELLCNKVRWVMVGLGFTEAMTYTLTSKGRNFGMMRTDGKAVEIENPISEDHEILRTSILPSLMEVLKENRRNPLPQSFFEVGDVVLLDSGAETGARDERTLCAVATGEGLGLAHIKSVADALMRELGKTADFQPREHPSFIEGRCANVVIGGKSVGVLGEIHPEVICGFDLEYPVSAMEIYLEKIEGQK